MSQSSSISRDGFSKFYRGQRLTARQLNALVDLALTRCPVDPGAFNDQFGAHHRPILRPKDDWVRCQSDDDVDAFGVVEVYDCIFQDGQPYFKVRTPSTLGRVFAGCEDYPLVAGADGWVRLITPTSPIRVRADQALSFFDIADTIIGDTQIEKYRGGGLLVLTASETLSGLFITGVVPLLGAPGLVGMTQGAVAQGQMGDVSIFRPAAGVAVSSWDDLTTSGELVPALFLFGAAPTTPAWVGLIDNGFCWSAYVIECVGA